MAARFRRCVPARGCVSPRRRAGRAGARADDLRDDPHRRNRRVRREAHHRRCPKHAGIVVSDREPDDVPAGAQDALRIHLRGLERVHHGGRRAPGGHDRARRAGAVESVAQVLSSPAVADAPPERAVAPALATVVVWAPAAIWSTVVLTLALTCWLVDEYLAGRRDTLRAMTLYAERFVEEFERPLIQPHLVAPSHPVARPVQARSCALRRPPGARRRAPLSRTWRITRGTSCMTSCGSSRRSANMRS